MILPHVKAVLMHLVNRSAMLLSPHTSAYTMVTGLRTIGTKDLQKICKSFEH